MSVETLRAELLAMTEPEREAEIEALPEDQRPTSEALAERHDVPIETVYEVVDQVIAATRPVPRSVFYWKWCAKRGLQP